jgi:hypothetical protein
VPLNPPTAAAYRFTVFPLHRPVPVHGHELRLFTAGYGPLLFSDPLTG